MNSAGDTLDSLFQPITLPKFPKLLVGTTATGIGGGVFRVASNGLSSIVHGEMSTLFFVLHIPGNAAGFVSTTAVSAVVRPAEHDPVPIIDPHSPELRAAQAALPASSPVGQPASAAYLPAPQWPLHGIITTQFGVPEPPYQPIHTGLDISDGHRPGVTPIRPFRPGRVIEAIHSRIRLGNEVVIDHGSGVTSVYGHLNSISVQQGQTVDENTIVGYEGTTGVSTGPHLHFEIRVNGQAVDPHKFISGQP
jgi:murein DD-endopeptidase MepM/ murein hydrolase activator NlpD